MEDLFFISITIFIITGLIYFLYKIMISFDRDKKDSELQITSKEILEQINILHSQKQYKIVEKLSNKYLAQKPGDDGVRIILAKVLYEQKRIYDAIDEAKIVLAHQSDNIEVKTLIANCYIEIEKPMKAISHFKEILEIEPSNITAIKGLAKLYFSTNQKKSAIKMYSLLNEYIESNLEIAKNKSIIADIHIEFMDYEDAIKEYEEILEIYPENLQIKKRLVEVYKRINDFESAINLSKELMSQSEDKEKLWALQQLMELFRFSSDYEKALEYANLIKDNPLSDKIQIGKDIAAILSDSGKLDESIDILKNLIKQDSENILLEKDLAMVYQAQKDYKAAVDVYKDILDKAKPSEMEAIHYDISNVYSNWAMHLFINNDNDGCFKKFTTAITYNAQNPDIYYRLGNVNKLIKNYNEAISQFKKAIELNPQNPDYYWAMSECYEEIDSIYEQKKVLFEYLKYDQINPKVYYKLGVILSIQNDPNAAIANLKKAVELDDEYISAMHKLALLLEHQGKKEDAIRLYEDILNLEPENEEIKQNLKMLNT